MHEVGGCTLYGAQRTGVWSIAPVCAARRSRRPLALSPKEDRDNLLQHGMQHAAKQQREWDADSVDAYRKQRRHGSARARHFSIGPHELHALSAAEIAGRRSTTASLSPAMCLSPQSVQLYFFSSRQIHSDSDQFAVLACPPSLPCTVVQPSSTW